jgi:hypothetical protein
MAQTGTEVRHIVAQMAKLRRATGAIGKNQKNAHQGWNFRGIDDILNAIGPALEEAGVVLTCRNKLLSFEANEGGGYTAAVEVTGTFTSTSDGSSMDQVFIGQGTDKSDKAIPKATSGGFKYMLFQGLQIPIDGALDDPDFDSPVVKKRTRIEK